MLKVKSAWTELVFSFLQGVLPNFFFFFFNREELFFGLIFQFLGKCGYLPSPWAPHHYCRSFCVFPIRLHLKLLIPPPHSVKTPTPGDPGCGNSADSRRHIPLTLLILVASFSHSSCRESRKFSFKPPLPPPRPPLGAESWGAGRLRAPPLRPPPLSPEGFNLHTCWPPRREPPTLPPGGSRAESASRAPAPATSPARAPSSGRSPTAPVHPLRAARAAPSAVPPPSAAVPTPSPRASW